MGKPPLLIARRDKAMWVFVRGLANLITYSRGRVVSASVRKIIKAYTWGEEPVELTANELSVIRFLLERFHAKFGVGIHETKRERYYMIDARRVREITRGNPWVIEELIANVVLGDES